MGELYADNWKLCNSGLDVAISKMMDNLENLSQVEKIRGLLDKYSKRFGEEAVIVQWGQDFGGPMLGYKAHKRSEVERMLARYEEAQVKGIYPKAGFVINYQWTDETEKFLNQSESYRRSRDSEYITEYLDRVFSGEF